MDFLEKVFFTVIITLIIVLSCVAYGPCNLFFLDQIRHNWALFSDFFSNVIPKLITIIILAIITKVLSGIAKGFLKEYFEHSGNQKEFPPIYSLIKYILWLLFVLVSISILYANFTALLASLGLIGFGITFALQKPILNLVGWLTLLVSKTYSIGDRIKIGEDRGDVNDIGIMYTTLDGLLANRDEYSGKLTTIPNEFVLTHSVENFNKNGDYIWDDVSVSITYESDWEKGVDLLEDAATKVVKKYVKVIHKSIDKKHSELSHALDILKRVYQKVEENKKDVIKEKMEELKEDRKELQDTKKEIEQEVDKPLVRVAMADSSVTLNVRYLCHYKKQMTMRSEINQRFLKAATKTKSVEIAYPHMQLVYNQSPEKQ
ncbi:MAG: mechanosensitive ion channel domain-containing protein [Candidatus Altiarchaeota archaeon]